MQIMGYEKKGTLIGFGYDEWTKLSASEKDELTKEIGKFRLCPSDRIDMFRITSDSKWLNVTPPKLLTFCYEMAQNLPEDNQNREQAIQVMEDMIPISSFEHHTRRLIIEIMVYLFCLKRKEKVWLEIRRLCFSFSDWTYVYNETGEKEALQMLILSCSAKKGILWKKIQRITKPEHKEYLQNVQL